MSMFNLSLIKDTFISSILPNTNYGTGLGLLVGQYSAANDIYRSLLKIDINSLPILATINYAYLKLYIYRNDQINIQKNIKIYRLISNFDENTVTFNTAPSYSSVILGNHTITNEINTYIRLNITDLVTGWYNGSIENNGIMLIGEEATPSLIGFRSADYQENLVRPQLEVGIEDGIIIYPTENFVTQDNVLGSTPVLLRGKKCTFGIVNNSETNNAVAYIQLSPDNITWIDDRLSFISETVFEPGGSIILNTSGYMKYARIAYKSQVQGSPANLSIYACVQN